MVPSADKALEIFNALPQQSFPLAFKTDINIDADHLENDWP